MYWDDQKKIADLKSQLDLDEQLDLHVWVPCIFTVNAATVPTLQFSHDGLILLLRDIRFTNRSKTNKVSLDLALIVPGRGGYFRVTEERLYWKILPDTFIFSPIDVDPQRTVPGDMCFLIPPETTRRHGGKWKINYNRCRLAVVDLVSGKMVIKDISQEALESQKGSEMSLFET
jgi:hypothetical protein